MSKNENAHFIKSEQSVSGQPTYNYRARNQALRLTSRWMIQCSHRYLRADRACVVTLHTRASSITDLFRTNFCRFIPKTGNQLCIATFDTVALLAFQPQQQLIFYKMTIRQQGPKIIDKPKGFLNVFQNFFFLTITQHQ